VVKSADPSSLSTTRPRTAIPSKNCADDQVVKSSVTSDRFKALLFCGDTEALIPLVKIIGQW
jgi:hypothetical protein